MSNRDDKPTDSRAVPDEAGLRLLVEIPALNEEPTIGEVIRRIPRQIPGIASVDVLVVDDSSTDRTRDRAIEAGAEVVTHARPQGVGAAFQTALTFALERRYDVIVSIDADGQFNPACPPEKSHPRASSWKEQLGDMP